MCIIVSCAFLFDAFRRLNIVKSNEQVISKKPVILLFVCFGVYGIAQVLQLPAELKSNADPDFIDTVVVFSDVSYLLSCVTLAAILFDLMVTQY